VHLNRFFLGYFFLSHRHFCIKTWFCTYSYFMCDTNFPVILSKNSHPYITFHGNPSCGSRVVSCGQTDRQTDGRREGQADKRKLTVAFRKFANSPKEGACVRPCLCKPLLWGRQYFTHTHTQTTRARTHALPFFWRVRKSVSLSAWNNSAPTGRISMKSNICEFFDNMTRKFKFL